MCGVGGCLHLSMHRHASSSSELESFDQEGRKEPEFQDFCYFLNACYVLWRRWKGGILLKTLQGECSAEHYLVEEQQV